MKNQAFVIWMLGYSLLDTINVYVNQGLLNHQYSPLASFLGEIFSTALWLFVGFILWEGEIKSKKEVKQ